MSHDTALRELAERLGIMSSYRSQDGTEERSTSDDTRVAILAAMGRDASSEAHARAELAELNERDAERLAEPVRVVRVAGGMSAREDGDRELREADARSVSTLVFRLPTSIASGVREGEAVEYALAIAGDSIGTAVRDGTARAVRDGVVEVSLEPGLTCGYHDLTIELAVRGRSMEAHQRLIVVPERCTIPARPGYGIVANLYSVRSARSWGVGDLGDLAELARWAGASGAAFVGVNPLHALRSVGGEVSPYSPVSRLYRNPAYLDIEAIPELERCAEARSMFSETMQAELTSIRRSDRVEYARRARLARPILAALHRCARSAGGSETSQAYAAYREREGRSLDEFATFMALDEYFVGRSDASLTWQGWPEEYRTPDSHAVRDFAREHEPEIDFHRWLQFELDSQLAKAASAGASAGLSVGLYQDLAVASVPYGSDVWANAMLHANGVEFGAPPDDYSATGQNWGLTPLDPHRLRENGYRYWTALVRSALRHAGALRIDHILGLFRQFWIPAGMNGSHGAYVRFPTDDLLGILALESARQHAVIVGEDLGTVPPEVPGTLRQWGILGTRVMLFEREGDGAFRPASSYEPLSLATANTHDLPTLMGFLEGNDVALAARLGRLPDADAERAAFRARQNDRRLLATRLIADGALAANPGEKTDIADDRTTAERAAAATRVETTDVFDDRISADGAGPMPEAGELRDAVHRFLCSTPALLAGISLDDIAGETEPVNVPGVSADRFASWTRRMRTPLGELTARPGVLPPGGCETRARE